MLLLRIGDFDAVVEPRLRDSDPFALGYCSSECFAKVSKVRMLMPI
jgi:hypothetical protein